MSNKYIIISALLLSTTFFCKAQNKVVRNNQQWIQYSSQLKLPEKFTLLTDVSLRRINDFKQWSQVTFRTGAGYNLNENTQAVIGIALFTFFQNDDLSRFEIRPYQEINTTQRFGKVSLQHRFRLEERYFRKISDGIITSESAFNFRFRYRLFCAIPLLSLSKSNPDKKMLLNISDEIFINAGKEIKYNMLDNNRLSAGLAFQPHKNLNISFTYTYQFGQRNAPSTYEHSDIFWIGIIHKLSLKNRD